MLKCNAFVKSALFHPVDDSILVTAPSDRKITFWDAKNGEPTREIEANENERSNVVIVTLQRGSIVAELKRAPPCRRRRQRRPRRKTLRRRANRDEANEDDERDDERLSLLAIGRALHAHQQSQIYSRWFESRQLRHRRRRIRLADLKRYIYIIFVQKVSRIIIK